LVEPDFFPFFKVVLVLGVGLFEVCMAATMVVTRASLASILRLSTLRAGIEAE
jgi:hypothetical protein